jgi:hypothetical protein
MTKPSGSEELLKKIESLREDLNSNFSNISNEELLKKSMALDEQIVKYMKLKHKIKVKRSV